MSLVGKKEPHLIVVELQKAQVAGLIMWYHMASRKNNPKNEEFVTFCIVKFNETTSEETKLKIQNYINTAYKDLSTDTSPQDKSILWINRRAPQNSLT